MSKSAGLHITMDAYVLDSAVFTRDTITTLFDKLVSALDMRMLGEPHIYEVPVDPEVLRRVEETLNFEDEGGITATCVISTSHMSIHCWPLQKFFSLDVFSCKSFDADRAITLISEVLGVSAQETRVHIRVRPEAPTV